MSRSKKYARAKKPAQRIVPGAVIRVARLPKDGWEIVQLPQVEALFVAANAADQRPHRAIFGLTGTCQSWLNTVMEPIKKVTKPLRGMSQRERREFAQSAGVPFDTVQKIAIGATKNPRWQTMSAIVDCLRARRKRGAE